MLSLKAAWSWIVRDLLVVRQSDAEVGDIQQVAVVAAEVVRQCGMSADRAASLVAWLRELIGTLEPPAQPPPGRPLHPGLANLIYTRALESIPDVHFWSDFPA